MQESNWFSAPSALRVYGQYLNLDKDHNGMLSKEELARLVQQAHPEDFLVLLKMLTVVFW